MIRVAWITRCTELESDLIKACEESQDVDLDLFWASTPAPDIYSAKYFARQKVATSCEERIAMMETAAAGDYDLYVFRYPSWIEDQGLTQTFHRLFHDLPVVGWSSEQGPTRRWAISAVRDFKCVAVNTRTEIELYRFRYPKKKLLYLPFGCRRLFADETTTKEEFRCDVISDGACHFGCNEEGGWKRRSVEALVRPVAACSDWDFACWGHDTEPCGWLSVPEIRERGLYKGGYHSRDYGHVYASAKIYLGISWNWSYGGFGMKLARALGAGAAVLWHRTAGAERDGIVDGKQLLFTSNAEETKERIDLLLRDEELRAKLSENGRRFALDNWEWTKNLQRLCDEVNSNE